MEILGFLLGLGCLVVIVWAIALFGSLISGWKCRRQSRSQERSPSTPSEFKRRTAASESPPVAPVQPRNVIALKRSPVSARVRLPSNKHQRYICLAELV